MKYFRLVKKEDVDMIFGWANDPVTRSMSFNTEPIPYENHVKWFDGVCKDTADMSSSRRLLILMDENTPVGQMRLDLEKNNHIILSYSIAPDYRGTGLGTELINLTMRYISSHLGRDLFVEQYDDNQILRDEENSEWLNEEGNTTGQFTIVAEVKEDNPGSGRILENNGFALTSGMDKEIFSTQSDSREINVYTHPVYEPLFIRVDMNETIATGHVMRCLSIADAASKLGIGVTFICADNDPVQIIRGRGYDTIILNSNWRQLDSELPLLFPIIKCSHIKHLLVDSYQVTRKYLEELRKATEITYIDDVNKFTYPVDKLVVYANYYRKWELEKKYSRNDSLGVTSAETFDAENTSSGKDKVYTELILGTDYVPLRSDYLDLPPKVISDEIKNILVLSGGSDKLHILRSIMTKLNEYRNGNMKNIAITAICGKYNPDYDELVSKYGEETIIKSVPCLKEYIQNADVVISAGGTTLYEICACGTPAITYSFADNQMDNVWQFSYVDKLMKYAGDVRDFIIKPNVPLLEQGDGPDRHQAYDKMIECLTEYEDKAVREDYSKRLQNFIDGRGAERIVRRIMNLRDMEK